MDSATPILTLRNVSKRFSKPLSLMEKISRIFGFSPQEQVIQAVVGIDLTIAKGEVVGLVGESGCGKSTLGRVAAGVLEASDGEIIFNNGTLALLRGSERRSANLAIQMVFQDPMASLNPRMRIVDAIGEAPIVHGLIRHDQKDTYVSEMLHRVGLDPALRRRFPHQFSGGQRTRIGIARALAVNPQVMICDEATASLDVSIQAQIINLFMQLRTQLSLTYIFISHDLGVIQHISDRVAVMYLGRIVELASTDCIFSAPNHPYTQALLEEIPRLEAKKRRFTAIKGEVPSSLAPPDGCHFHPRCPHAGVRCKTERPLLKEIAPARFSACHLNNGGVGDHLNFQIPENH